MKIKLFLLKIIVILTFAVSSAFAAQSEYFDEGKKLFDDKKFNDSKFFFERDLVFNPKSEKSYLYLAKIFDESENNYEMESNLNKVLLLNPKNEEAIYLLAMLKIKLSDYEEAKKLLEKFSMTCKSFCSKQKVLQKKLNTLNP
tara:strand:+ start:54 stop:482 length:429 start_codon:yes stop_codon:yes gene_type:complete